MHPVQGDMGGSGDDPPPLPVEKEVWLLKIFTSCPEERARRRRAGRALLSGGIAIAVVGLLLLLQPYYSYARELTRADYWLKQECLEADPGAGEPGNLYDALTETITCSGRILYSGPMSALVGPINLGDLAGPIYPGKKVKINFTVLLPGPETGNESQGASLKSSYALIAEWDDREAVFSPVVSPAESIFDLANLAPGDEYSADLRVVFDVDSRHVDLPRTAGGRFTIFIALSGLLMIALGLIVKRPARKGSDLI
jgi:hypothetical protein